MKYISKDWLGLRAKRGICKFTANQLRKALPDVTVPRVGMQIIVAVVIFGIISLICSSHFLSDCAFEGIDLDLGAY